jgi:hypothetical protein
MGIRFNFLFQSYLFQVLLSSYSSLCTAVILTKPFTTILKNSMNSNRVNSVARAAADVITTQTPKIFKQLYPTIIEKSRTIPNVCVTGTLCTSSNTEEILGSPFGSSVDYITDEKGWPILLLNQFSEHSQNILTNPSVSLFCQLPTSQYYGEIPSGLGQVTIVGKIVPITKREELSCRYAFPLVHPHTEPFVSSSKYSFLKIQPKKILYTGGYGVLSSWINVTEYEQSKPDALATEIPRLLPRINLEKETELKLVCKHFLQLESPIEMVKIQTIDRLGFDLRVRTKKGLLCFRSISFLLLIRSRARLNGTAISNCFSSSGGDD